MVSESPDPTVVRSIAVTAADVVAALEANRTSNRRVVLRLTPPFSGRMRARLHVEHEGEYEHNNEGESEHDNEGESEHDSENGAPRPLHIDPESLLIDTPAYPNPDRTENQLRERDPPYTVDRHHEYHTAAVEEWRAKAPDTICDQITLETPAGPHEVTVKVLRGAL